MILVRFVQTFRERCPEWVMACFTTGWGWNAWTDALADVKRHTFDSAFYSPLLATGVPQVGWGAYAMSVGVLRLTCLYVNGRRPRGSSAMRAIGAWFSFMFWSGLWVGALSLPWNAGARWSYGAFMALDFAGLFFAATDFNLAFRRVREASIDERE